MNSQRYARIREMLAKRQPDLTVCMEQVHKPHNVSAIIRTADAVGVHEVHAVWPGNRMRTMASSAAGSNSWVEVKTHRTIGDAVGTLKARGMQILATHLSDKAVDGAVAERLRCIGPDPLRSAAPAAKRRNVPAREQYAAGRRAAASAIRGRLSGAGESGET